MNRKLLKNKTKRIPEERILIFYLHWHRSYRPNKVKNAYYITTQRKKCDELWLPGAERFPTIYNMSDFAALNFSCQLLLYPNAHICRCIMTHSTVQVQYMYMCLISIPSSISRPRISSTSGNVVNQTSSSQSVQAQMNIPVSAANVDIAPITMSQVSYNMYCIFRPMYYRSGVSHTLCGPLFFQPFTKH